MPLQGRRHKILRNSAVLEATSRMFSCPSAQYYALATCSWVSVLGEAAERDLRLRCHPVTSHITPRLVVSRRHTHTFTFTFTFNCKSQSSTGVDPYSLHRTPEQWAYVAERDSRCRPQVQRCVQLPDNTDLCLCLCLCLCVESRSRALGPSNIEIPVHCTPYCVRTWALIPQTR